MVIHPRSPYLGASPDGVVTCSCCGTGAVEVKCPFSCTEESFSEAAGSSAFYSESVSDESFNLKETHSYFYQLQLQMCLCDVKYGWREDELVVKINNQFLDDTLRGRVHLYGCNVNKIYKPQNSPFSNTSNFTGHYTEIHPIQNISTLLQLSLLL